MCANDLIFILKIGWKFFELVNVMVQSFEVINVIVDNKKKKKWKLKNKSKNIK